jgi:hypothetical protein
MIDSSAVVPGPGNRELNLGDVLAAYGLDPADVVVLHHTNQAEGIPNVRATTADAVVAYTRNQHANFKRGNPPRWWLVFMDDGSAKGVLRSRFYGAFENFGESLAERTDTNRFYDLRPTDLFGRLQNRLVISWNGRGFHRGAQAAAALDVVEIADPEVVPFVGFDRVFLTYAELQKIFTDSRYVQWVTALKAVQGIYLIADTTNGKLYVGKADGGERIFGRWSAYARNGHGDNVELKRLLRTDPNHCERFVYSLLRVFGPEATQETVNVAESHYKKALLSRVPHGYNAN